MHGASERGSGSVLVMALVIFAMFFVIGGALAVFINRQFRETVAQGPEEQAFHVAEAGIHYVLFLLSAGIQTPQSLLNLGALTQSVTEPVSGDEVGTYTLIFSPAPSAGLGVAIESSGWDVRLRRCQTINAVIGRSATAVPYQITAWDHVVTCSANPPPSPTPGQGTAGPNLASVVLSDSDGGKYVGEPWVDLNNITLKNGATASSFFPGDERSTYLMAKGFNFNIPPSATIDGIGLTANRMRSGASSLLTDDRVRIIKANAVGTQDKADKTTNWPTTLGLKNYGGPNDRWGITTWSAGDIESPDFGVAFSARNNEDPGGPSNTAEVDFIEATVYYSVP